MFYLIRLIYSILCLYCLIYLVSFAYFSLCLLLSTGHLQVNLFQVIFLFKTLCFAYFCGYAVAWLVDA
jgi:hypothetical protein